MAQDEAFTLPTTFARPMPPRELCRAFHIYGATGVNRLALAELPNENRIKVTVTRGGVTGPETASIVFNSKQLQALITAATTLLESLEANEKQVRELGLLKDLEVERSQARNLKQAVDDLRRGYNELFAERSAGLNQRLPGATARQGSEQRIIQDVGIYAGIIREGVGGVMVEVVDSSPNGGVGPPLDLLKAKRRYEVGEDEPSKAAE